ncbi:TolC family protein [Geomonas sp. RF6]|uniref:TolC family protein n=1 Tax=Geomonas sp. RF6 TaxID=2897342 RepID=UPI001E58D348|nr:TolC family protein [Geomonas sp. RF6]UFS69988.1 TolC family protein [Geomonas sp. RF6]
MRCTIARASIFLVGLLLEATASIAAEDSVTLDEAIQRALASNHLIKAASSTMKAAEASVDVARTRYLPSVFLDSGALVSTTPSRVFMMKLDEGRIAPATDFAPSNLNHPSPRGDFQTSFTLQQPLVDFSIRSAVDAAEKDAASADLSLQIQKEQVTLRVYEAYLEVRRAKAFVGVAEQGVADAGEHARLAATRHTNGLGLKSDELRTRASVAEAQQKLVGAQHDLTVAKLRLNLLTGGNDGILLDIAGEPGVPDPSGPENLVQLALMNRPDLKAGRTAVEKGEVGVRQAQRAYYPTVYASAGYQLNDRDVPFGNDNDSWNAGINLRWELFDGTRRSHEKARALAARDAAAAMLENERREVALQVRESLLRRSEARLKLDSARAALSAAEEDVRLVRKRYENGLASVVELMDAETALNTARANVVEVGNGLLKATAHVYYAAGVLLKEVTK